MSYGDDSNINIDNSLNSSIIEEKIGNTDINFSEVMKLYEERILLGRGSKVLFEENDIKNLDLSEKKKFKIDGPFQDLIYEDKKVYFPIIVTFQKGNINKTYKIYTQKLLDKIYDEINYESPFLLIGNSYEKFEKEKLNFLFTHPEKHKNFIITDIKDINYEQYYSENYDILRKNECNPSYLTPNFEFYFTSPKTNCNMSFKFSRERKDVIDSIIDFRYDKIHSIFGPYGNGKTTTLIIVSKLLGDVCYLNLKALYNNKKNVYIWKFKLFLLELFNLFKKDKKTFEKIKEKILVCNHFWEAINLTIKFCIENKKNSIFILDQFKEDIDPKFTEFKEIKLLINEKSNNFVKLIVSSSINNLDIRDFIIDKYKKHLSDLNFSNNYRYIPVLFKLSDIEGLVNTLSENKKKIFEEYFSNIPVYFYNILDSSDEEIYKTVAKIKNSIIEDIEAFYLKNGLSLEDLSLIIKNYSKIGVGTNKDDNVKIDKDIISKFIKILPIKFFILDINDEEIVNISFYFKLAKICFLEVIIKRLYELLEQPKLQIPQRAIGDLLEAIVIENFKNNSIEKFDQICKVNSIWNMNYVKDLDKNKVKQNNILIIQEDEDAKLIDFGFLLLGEILILVQCKKSLSQMPEKYITINNIITHKHELFKLFNEHFKCDIKKIKLFYITGIYFTDYQRSIFKTWSAKEQSFDVLEKITTTNNIPLVFFDVHKKQLLIKNDADEKKFEKCSILGKDSLICNEERYSFVEINPKPKELFEILEGIKNHNESQEINFIEKFCLEEKSENRTDSNFYSDYFKRNIISNKRVIVTEPDSYFLSNKNEDILNTFKINGKKCFSYYDKEKNKIEYREIKNGMANNLDLNDFKIYFLQKKTQRVKKSK